MKKSIFLLTVLFLLLLGNVYSQTVYITKTGEKYHNEGCRYLKKSAYSIHLSDAIAKGYTACKVCKPPTSINKANNKPAVSEKKKSATTYKQCSATTKKGSRCKRTTKSSNGRCWQHSGN